MAKMTLRLPDDLMRQIERISVKHSSIVEEALQAGGEVVLKKAQDNLNAVVGKGTKHPSRSTGELKRSLGLSPVKSNSTGVDIKVGFSEPHSGGVSNAMLASIIEYGKHGQPAKPFMTPAKHASRKECIAAIRAKFESEVGKL